MHGQGLDHAECERGAPDTAPGEAQCRRIAPVELTIESLARERLAVATVGYGASAVDCGRLGTEHLFRAQDIGFGIHLDPRQPMVASAQYNSAASGICGDSQNAWRTES